MRPGEAQRLGLVALGIAFAFACTESRDPTREKVDGLELVSTGRAITIGDIDPSEPAKRIRRLQPLADLLGRQLGEHGIERGSVVVARSINEMAELLRSGEVDLLFDSAYPVLRVREASQGEVLLRRAVGEDFEYWSLFVAPRDGPVRQMGDLVGRTLALQETHSTSGYLLPMISLDKAGLVVERVEGPASTIQPDRVGVFFSQDEENTVQMLRDRLVDAGVISNQEFDNLPEDYRQSMVEVGRTPAAPRQLVLARQGLSPRLAADVQRVLLSLTEDDRERMAADDPGFGWTWNFAPVDDNTVAVLSELEALLSIASAP